jgi:histone-lysine N-methyltransferase SETD7
MAARRGGGSKRGSRAARMAKGSAQSPGAARRRTVRPSPSKARVWRGTVTDDEGVRFEGWFNEEGLHGRGTMHFPDGGWQCCTWVDGVPHGPGEYVGDDLSIIRGTWVDGELEGHVTEHVQGGFLVYDGPYSCSRRHGQGVLHFRDGSRIEGVFVEGTLHGPATFFYPDGISGFEGQWEDGDMHKARYFGPEPPAPPFALDIPGRKALRWSDVVFKSDETSETSMGSTPLLRDPYETRRCAVGRSQLCDTPLEGAAEGNTAGEGLFTRCAIAQDELICYYNGVRVPHSKVDRRAWRDNGNCISLDSQHAIDVPEVHASLDAYSATVGHKANHAFRNNARYVEVYHPRFGHIKGIRALHHLKPGEEVRPYPQTPNRNPRSPKPQTPNPEA